MQQGYFERLIEGFARFMGFDSTEVDSRGAYQLKAPDGQELTIVADQERDRLAVYVTIVSGDQFAHSHLLRSAPLVMLSHNVGFGLDEDDNPIIYAGRRLSELTPEALADFATSLVEISDQIIQAPIASEAAEENKTTTPEGDVSVDHHIRV